MEISGLKRIAHACAHASHGSQHLWVSISPDGVAINATVAYVAFKPTRAETFTFISHVPWDEIETGGEPVLGAALTRLMKEIVKELSK